MASTLRSYSLDLLPNLHPTLLRLLRGQMEALVLSIVRCFNSFLCSFQGAIEVSTDSACLSAHFSVFAKLQNDTETIFDSKKTFSFSPTFAGSFTGLPPALLPS